MISRIYAYRKKKVEESYIHDFLFFRKINQAPTLLQNSIGDATFSRQKQAVLQWRMPEKDSHRFH
jgi:hypothetical protein